MDIFQPAIFDIDAFYWDVLIQSKAECRLRPDLPPEARMVRIDTDYKDTTVWLLDYAGSVQAYTNAQALATKMLEIGGKPLWE